MKPTTFALLIVLSLSGPAQAQVIAQRLREDVPAITQIAPVGLQRGQKVELTLTGERLEGIDRILGPRGLKISSIAAADAKQARLTVEVAADTAPGVYVCYFLAKSGLSNPKLISIDAWPQFVEHEDNNRQSEATPVSLPCGASGVLSAADHDWYRFEATSGQRVVFDVLAQRLGSPLRPVLTLYDSSGRELQQQMIAPRDISPDNRLVYTFRDAGSYFVRIRDLTYAGADFAVYQLRMGEMKFATAMFPLGGQRGAKTPVTFTGGTLTEPLIHEVDLTVAPPWQSDRLRVPLGDDMLISPAFFAAGDSPEILETEPNDLPAQALPLSVPLTANGRIDRSGDRDVYRFHAAAGSKLMVRLAAQQLGSPLDAVVTISDATGKEVLALDDRQPAPREAPLVRVVEMPLVDDPLGEFTAAIEGDYFLTVEDRFDHGGPEYGYRLELASSAADFDLVVQPAEATANLGQPGQQQPGGPLRDTYSGAGSGSLSLDRGGSGNLLVRAFRNGYNGPIDLSVEGMPEGVHAGRATITAGQNETAIPLTTDFAAASTAGFVRVIGSTPGDASTPPLRRLALEPVVFSALPINGGLQRNLADVAVGISQQGAELAIQAALTGRLVPGGKVTAQLTAQRREGYVGKIEVKFTNLPSGLTAPAGTLGEDQTSTELELLAGPDLTPGTHRLVVEATMQAANKKEPIIALFPLAFDVLPLATLELAQQQVDVPLAGGAKLELNVRRNLAELAQIELVLTGLPKGVTASTTTIEASVERFELNLTAGDGASASPIRRIVQIKPRLKAGDRAIDLPTLRFALRVTK